MRLFILITAVCLWRCACGQQVNGSADTDQVKRFYQLVKLPSPWIQHQELSRQLSQVLHQAPIHGLDEQAYPLAFLDSIQKGLLTLSNGQDMAAADARLTMSALCFFRTLATGNGLIPVAYEGVRSSRACIDVTALLANAVNQRQVAQLPELVEPATDLYKTLRDTLQSLLKTRNDTASTNDMQSEPASVARIDALQKALNTARWLRCLLEEQCVLVNIPAAHLHYYEQGKIHLSSRVIVGKPSTPTGTLSSRISEVILYPYWTVPAKIASRELLPHIKRNPGYLQANGYQVLSNGKVIDASPIDWTKYSSTYFPFTLRQSTGCDNSMGIIKLNFTSPYGLFLHDTPWKVLFNAPKRYLSHGCVRVERVAELARMILKDDSLTFNSIIQKGDSLNTQPTTMRLSLPVPVVIVYETAWPDLNGAVRFYEDIYRKYARKSKP